MEVVLARTSPLLSPACDNCALSFSIYIPDEHADIPNLFTQAALIRHVCSLRSRTAQSALRLTIGTQGISTYLTKQLMKGQSMFPDL